jgi:hypothetical protein
MERKTLDIVKIVEVKTTTFVSLTVSASVNLLSFPLNKTAENVKVYKPHSFGMTC